MRIAVVFRADYHEGTPVPCYAWSYVDAFREMGHEVCVNHSGATVSGNLYDFALEIENGRDEKGELRFGGVERGFRSAASAVLLIDSHGHPDLHAEVAKSYDHVFFAVWARRDLFAGHPSAHWCPNATDLKWFGAERFAHITPEFDVGFFGSKKGLSRADDLVAICKANGWTYDVRQVANNRNVNRWPATGEAMARCRVLFNRGQKHDGPNQRVMESMAVGRPLLTDVDERDGMGRAFLREDVPHYYSYNDSGDLEAALRAMLRDDRLRKTVGAAGQHEVEAKHLIKHRAEQILEVVSR